MLVPCYIYFFSKLFVVNTCPPPTLRISHLLFNHTLNLCTAFFLVDRDDFYGKCSQVVSGEIDQQLRPYPDSHNIRAPS